jgi:hypothetical protein
MQTSSYQKAFGCGKFKGYSIMLKKTANISGWQIRISGMRLKAWNKVSFSSVCMTNKNGHTINMADVHVLLSIRILIKTLKIKRSVIGLFAEQIQIFTPAATLKAERKQDINKEKGFPCINWETRLYPAVTRLFHMLFSTATKQIAITKLLLTSDQTGSTGSLLVENVNLLNNCLSGRCIMRYKQITGTFSFSAKIYQEKKKIDLCSTDTRLSLKNVGFVFVEKCQISCVVEKKTAFARLNIVMAAEKVKVDHPVFSSSPVIIETSSADLGLIISKEKLEICRESEVVINEIPVLFQVIHEMQEADIVKCVFVFIIQGASFFKSYPFFNNKGLTDIQAEGEIVIQLSYILSMSDPLQYYFNTEILRNDFQVTELGSFILSNKYITNIVKRRSSNDINKRTEDWSWSYACLAEMPAYFTDIVVNAEDPNFYKHSGIDPYFIGIAAAENLRSRRFKKGASTITMQLCKNLFFYTDKCITRKIDEMIVAWLLENFLKLSKEQILETYLNIIEFAEGVYGIKAAAKYYFNKEVTALNLLECITISYIIPRPRFFLEALLMLSPQLRTNLRKHIDLHLRKLNDKDLITRETFEGITYVIEFELNAFNNKKITLKW